MVLVIYGFGDASGEGFGSSFANSQGLSWRVFVWSRNESDESSNWQEFTNIVESLEEEAASGAFVDCEVFFFTDNSTVEACFYKGSSSSPLLHALVVRLRELEVKYSIHLVICHVSGKRMIAGGYPAVSSMRE